MKNKEAQIFRISDIFELSKMSKSDWNTLFYLSLFEIKHFESPYFNKSSKEIRGKIEKFMRKFGKGIWKKKQDIAIVNYFLSGKICNLIISYELGKRLKMKVSPHKVKGLDGKILAQFDGWIDKIQLILEIKRIVSTSQLGEYVDETIKKAKKIKKISRNKKFKYLSKAKILTVFVFICEDEKELNLLNKMIPGFKNLFQKLRDKEVVPSLVEFFMIGYTEKSALENFINILSERIKNIIKESDENAF